jgi:hypothetical protein
MSESNLAQTDQLLRESELLKSPSPTGKSIGRLPRGTVLKVTGALKGKFVQVDVELQDGWETGWVRATDLRKVSKKILGESSGRPSPRSDTTDDGSEDEGDPDYNAKYSIPKDEGILLRREPSFLYGIQLTGGASILTDEAGANYLGPAFGGGAHFGIFLARNMPLRLEAGYLLTSGTSPEGAVIAAGTPVSVGFFDLGLMVGYDIGAWEVFGGFTYSMGVSVNDIPKEIQIAAPADFSSAWFVAGGGYRIGVSDVIAIVLRGRYGISFLRGPLGFQTIQAGAYLELRG